MKHGAQADSFEGYAVPPGRYTAKRTRGPRYPITLGLWVLTLVAVMMTLAIVDQVVPDVPTRYVCPPDCGRPPTGQPVATNPRFTAADGSSYPAPGAAYTVSTEADGVTAKWVGGDGGTLRLFSQPAAGRDARTIAEALLNDAFPGAIKSYELPNATVGYQLGYGEVADFNPMSGGGEKGQVRIIIIVAVKNDLALVAGAAGPFREFTPSFGPGPPSPANLQIAQDMGKYVNSFMWRGDPPR